MSQPRPRREANLTLRLDVDVLLWARTRALFAHTSVNALIRRFLEEYAAVPDRYRRGLPPPWTDAANAAEAFAEVVDASAAGARARSEPGSRPVRPRRRGSAGSR